MNLIDPSGLDPIDIGEVGSVTVSATTDNSISSSGYYGPGVSIVPHQMYGSSGFLSYSSGGGTSNPSAPVASQQQPLDLSTPCNLTLPSFSGLETDNPAARDLLVRRFGAEGAAQKYNDWGVDLRAVFLNTVTAITAAGINLSGATFESFYHGNDLTEPAFGITLSSVGGLGDLVPFAGTYRSPINVSVGSLEASRRTTVMSTSMLTSTTLTVTSSATLRRCSATSSINRLLIRAMSSERSSGAA